MKKEKTIPKEKADQRRMDTAREEANQWQNKYILLLEKYNHLLKNQTGYGS